MMCPEKTGFSRTEGVFLGKDASRSEAAAGEGKYRSQRRRHRGEITFSAIIPVTTK
jgi:hypothetical protein